MARFFRYAPVLLVAVLGLVVVVSSLRDDAATPQPVDITADTMRFEDVADLVAVADLIVEGSVSAVDDGRIVGDPTSPDAGVRTQLARVDAERRVPQTADTTSIVIVEQEAQLLGGTPITVNGVEPLESGEHVILVLVGGATEEFPYTTPFNEQAVFHVSDGVVRAADRTGPIGRQFDGRPVEELRTALALDRPGPPSTWGD